MPLPYSPCYTEGQQKLEASSLSCGIRAGLAQQQLALPAWRGRTAVHLWLIQICIESESVADSKLHVKESVRASATCKPVQAISSHSVADSARRPPRRQQLAARRRAYVVTNGSPAVPLCRAVVRGGTTGAAQPLQLSSLLPAMFVQPRWAQGRVSSAASRCSGQRRSSCCRAGRGPLAPRLQAAAQGICQPATCILPLLFAARLRQVLQLSAAGPHAWRSRSSQKTCAHRPCSAAAATAVPLLLLCRVLLLLLLLL